MIKAAYENMQQAQGAKEAPRQRKILNARGRHEESESGGRRFQLPCFDFVDRTFGFGRT